MNEFLSSASFSAAPESPAASLVIRTPIVWSSWVPTPYYLQLGSSLSAGILASTLFSLSYALLPGSGSPYGAGSSSRYMTPVLGRRGVFVGCRLRGPVIGMLSSQRRPIKCLLPGAACVRIGPSTSRRSSCLARVCRVSVRLVRPILGYHIRSGAVG